MLENTKPFTFKGIDDKEYSMPAVKAIPTGILRVTRKITDEADQAFTLLELLLGEDSDTLKALDAMPAEQFQATLIEWQKGASLGESVGSES